MLGEIRLVGSNRSQPLWIDLLNEQLIERPGELSSKPNRFGSVHAIGHMPPYQRRQEHEPLHRSHGGRYRVGGQRVEEAAETKIQFIVADGDQARQEEPALGAAHEGICYGANGAVVREKHDAAGELRHVRVLS
jgi:hypothetical protein